MRTKHKQRSAALVALVAAVAAFAVWVWILLDDFQLLVLAQLGLMLLVFGMLRAAVSHWPRSVLYLAVGLVGLGLMVIAVTKTEDAVWWRIALVAGLLAVFTWAARTALGPRGAEPSAQSQPFRARRGVLILNPKSGGGKAERFQLADKARAMGLEAVVLEPDDDLEQLARDAVARGADALGMGGGDGSQALVASVCVEHDLPLVCIPAGTRNHFAMDLGLDRSDPSLALAAFEGEERRIDFGLVNDRLFVNNVSLGLYARIILEPSYRDAKAATALKLLPDMLGEDATPFDLRFEDPEGTKYDFAQLVQISNNPYLLTPGDAFGYRTRLDGGELGVIVLAIKDARALSDGVDRLIADPTARVDGFRQWCAPRFEVDSKDAKVLTGIDGEALQLDAPLRFESRPGGLRVLVPPGTPRQVAPPGIPHGSELFNRLWNVAHGREPDEKSV